MKCPACASVLERVLYEGMAVFRCGACHGYLMARRRMEGIQAVRRRTIEELKQESLSEAQPDSQAVLRCPRCFGQMEKQSVKEPASLRLDVCPKCEYVWLDGGELARMQLSHEISQQAQDAQEMRARVEAMTPEAKAEYERNLKKMKAQDWTLGSVVCEVLLESVFRGGRRPWGL